jgi:hypothetical protein
LLIGRQIIELEKVYNRLKYAHIVIKKDKQKIAELKEKIKETEIK